MAKRHLLNVAKAAKYDSCKFVTVGDDEFKFTLYTYGNASGFVHFAILSKKWDWDNIAHAKAQYYNRTWERFDGQSVYRECVDWALKSKDITEEQAQLLKEALR